MPIDVRIYTQFRGYAIAPEDYQINEVETKDIQINRGGVISSTKVRRLGVAIVLRGVTPEQVNAFHRERQNTSRNMIRARNMADLPTISISGVEIKEAALVQVNPSAPVLVGGSALIEQCQLVFESQVMI